MGGFSSSREISLAKASHLFGELPLEFQLNLALLLVGSLGRLLGASQACAEQIGQRVNVARH